MKEQFVDRIDPVHQTGIGMCGPASLEIALRALDIDADQAWIAEEIPDIQEGMSWIEMQAIANHYGCETSWEDHSTYESLLEIHHETGCPIIVGWNSDRDGEPGAHFSVVKYVNNQMITLADPQYEDYIVYLREQFVEKWFDDETTQAFMVIFPHHVDDGF